MPDEEIDLSDIPEVTEEQMRRATLRVSGKLVERGYQALMNQVLAHIHHRSQ